VISIPTVRESPLGGGLLNEPCRPTIPEAIFGSSWPKGNQLGHQWRGKKQ
jgi:hypothetical protein